MEHEGTGAPVDFVVYQNYPNPFNPATNIRFQLDAERRVRISVFNVLGEKIAELLDESKPAGIHAITWNASRHPSGTYFGRVEVAGKEDGFVQGSKIFKMIVVK
ncbi:MAG: T9SS type A sorting domain-containing protein [Ignavibacteriales bacterium]|nr:T9SS type A sorting domain-containing protein [Ignavibacteriales bacterium]